MRVWMDALIVATSNSKYYVAHSSNQKQKFYIVGQHIVSAVVEADTSFSGSAGRFTSLPFTPEAVPD